MVAPERAFDMAVANLRSAIEESKAEVVRDPLPAVKGDEIQIAQLFQNLIANALKFRDRGSPRVYVSAKLDGDTWVVSVSRQWERHSAAGVCGPNFWRVPAAAHARGVSRHRHWACDAQEDSRNATGGASGWIRGRDTGPHFT